MRLSETPEIWLQLTPRSAAFAGVRADASVLSGSLELSGSAETFVGRQPPAAAPTALPPLGADVSQPGEFAIMLPILVGYDALKDDILRVTALIPPETGVAVRDAEVYPSSGRLVVGLRVAKTSETDPSAGQWVYLAGSLQSDPEGRAAGLSDLGAVTDSQQLGAAIEPIVAQLRDKLKLDYGTIYQNMLKSFDEKLSRPLKNGFRMEGHLISAKLQQIFLSSNGVVITLRASGGLRILYGM